MKVAQISILTPLGLVTFTGPDLGTTEKNLDYYLAAGEDVWVKGIKDKPIEDVWKYGQVQDQDLSRTAPTIFQAFKDK